jgi:hypothetical protein
MKLKDWRWIFFVLVGIQLVAYGIYSLTLYRNEPSHWNFLTLDTSIHEYISGVFQASGLSSLGFGVLTIVISYFHYRHGSKGTWYAFLFFPLFFTLAIFFTWPGIAWLPLLILSTFSLYSVYKDNSL